MTGLLVLAVLAGSWNLKWFPSGRAEHRASPRVETANIRDAADVIRTNFKGRGRVLFLQELRNPQACSNLVTAIGDSKLFVAVASSFRDERDNRLQWQQLAIVTDLPVIEAHWRAAQKSGRMFVPRGYAYALLDGGRDGRIACFCVHLKSNYGAYAGNALALNASKRAAAIRQVLSAARKVDAAKVLIAGDFNADRFQPSFAGEKTFTLLDEEGFSDGWAGVAADARGTHPGSGRFPDSTLDYVFYRGFKGCVSRVLVPEAFVSDHRMVVMSFK